MLDAWEADFAARAAAYWTAERTDALVRGKRLELLPGEAGPLLRALGLLDRDASLPPARARKFFQINHMVAVLRPSLVEVMAGTPGPLRVLDAGCGRSYLSLVLAWVVRERWGRAVEVLGVDRNPALVVECARRAAIARLEGVVRYSAGDLATADPRSAWASAFGVRPPEGDPPVHGLVSLHACDTATCAALALGVRGRVPLIACAPCCHAELAAGWRALDEVSAAGPFAPLWGAPHLRRETAASVTDALRMLLLRAHGYRADALEFVPSEHTPKNTLLRAVHRGLPNPAAADGYTALVAATGGVGIALERALARVEPSAE